MTKEISDKLDKVDPAMIERFLTSWHEYNNATGKHVTLTHYTLAIMCQDCREAYQKNGEIHLPHKPPYFRKYLKQHPLDD